MLTADWAKTLCGLKIVPIVIDRKAKHVFASPSNKLSAGELVRIVTGSSEKKDKRREWP